MPPTTSSPCLLPTGMLSPVIMLSSTDERPCRTRPSTGILSPARTRTRSPRTTCSIGMSSSVPAPMSRAVRGASPISLRIASEVWLRARLKEAAEEDQGDDRHRGIEVERELAIGPDPGRPEEARDGDRGEAIDVSGARPDGHEVFISVVRWRSALTAPR